MREGPVEGPRQTPTENLDAFEEEARQVLALAAATIATPPGSDLMRAAAAARAAAAGTDADGWAAGLAAASVTLLALTAPNAPSARAQVARAAAATLAESYRITIGAAGGPQITGRYDPARQVGMTDLDGLQIIDTGGYSHERLPEPDTEGKTWIRMKLPTGSFGLPTSALSMFSGLQGILRTGRRRRTCCGGWSWSVASAPSARRPASGGRAPGTPSPPRGPPLIAARICSPRPASSGWWMSTMTGGCAGWPWT